MFVVGGMFAAYAYIIALYLQRVLDYSEIRAAFALAPAPLSLALVSTFLARRLLARIGLRLTMLLGLASMIAGQLWLTRLGADSGYLVHVLPGLLLTAGGGGFALPAVSVGAMRGAVAADRGLAGGMLPTAQQVGAAVVLAALATIAAARTTHTHSLVAGYRTAYLVSACLLAALALLVARTRMDI
jgi:hypothetical protein